MRRIEHPKNQRVERSGTAAPAAARAGEGPAAVEEPQAVLPPASLPRAGPLERRVFDYGNLEAAMQAMDVAIQKARVGLARLAGTARADDDAAG